MGHYIPPKLPLPLGGSGPHLTRYLEPTRVFNPNGILIDYAVLVWVPNAMLYNALSMSMGTKILKLPLTLGISPPHQREPSHNHKQHA